MVKSGRKRKKLDKAKVQLKKGTGKKSLRLPKGLNVTDARVTTNKITLVNQLHTASASDGPLTKKKIGMKDLLSKLNSLSSSIRIDGLEGIMELIKSEENSILDDHLSVILNKIAPLATDRENKIRKLANTIFSTIVKQVDVLQVEPMYPMLSAHLCCGLSHIDTYIQRDSLKHLDEILNFLPGLISKNFQLILPNCLNQISMQQNTGSGGISTSDKARTITTNVDEKISSLEWRREVLQRVQKLFEIVIKKQEEEEDEIKGHHIVKDVQKLSDVYYMGLYVDNFASHVNENLSMADVQNNYFQRNLNAQQKEENSSLDKNYAKSLVPLLLDTWSEALLSSAANLKTSKWGKNGAPQNQIGSDIGPILEAVVKTLHLLVKHFKKTFRDFDEVSQIGAFQREYEPKITKQMLDNFPYQLVEASAANKNKNDKKADSNSSNDDIIVSQINLSIISLYLDLISGEPSDGLTIRVINYLRELFELVPTNNTVTQVAEILLKLFESKIPEHCATTINQLISKMLIHHSNNAKLVDFLGSLVVRSDHNIDSVKIWIEKLPEILATKNGTSKHRQVVQFLLKQRNKTLLKVLPQNYNYFELMKQC